MHKKIGIMFILATIILFSGCVSDEGTQPSTTISEETSQSSSLFSGRALSEGNLSVCAIISAEDVEDDLGLSQGSLYRGASFLSFSEVMVNKCLYQMIDPIHPTPQLSVEYVYYGPGSVYEGSEPLDLVYDPINTTEGNVGGHEYFYSESSHGIYNLLIPIPQERILVKIVSLSNFPGAGEEGLKNLASTFVSRVDPSDDSPHQLTPPSSEMATYEGELMTFQYPSNWVADRQYEFGDHVELRDPDGINIMYVAVGSRAIYSSVQEFEDTLQSSREAGVEILEGSGIYEKNGTNTYRYIGMKDGAPSIFQDTTSDELGLTLSATGLIVGEDRYFLYEDAILRTLSSIEWKE